jgi:hypothetical protein
MAIGLIPPRFIVERTPVLLAPSTLVADVSLRENSPGVPFRNFDTWNSLSVRVICHAESHIYNRHPNCPLTSGLVPDLRARAEFCVWQEMLVGQTTPSPSVQVKSWAFGFQYPHSTSIRCRQDKVESHRFDISGSNGVHGNHGAHGSDGSSGRDGSDGKNGSNGSHGSDGGHGMPGKGSANGSSNSSGNVLFAAVVLEKLLLLCAFCALQQLTSQQEETVPLGHQAKTQAVLFSN